MTKKGQESTNRRGRLSISRSFKAQNPCLKWKNLLQTGDNFMQIVKLDGDYLDHIRYLCIVCHNDQDEFCLLGVDEQIEEDSKNENHTIGIKLLNHLRILVKYNGPIFIIKNVSQIHFML